MADINKNSDVNLFGIPSNFSVGSSSQNVTLNNSTLSNSSSNIISYVNTERRKREGSLSYSSFTSFILRSSCDLLSEYQEIMNKYKELTGKEYIFNNDEVMLSILRSTKYINGLFKIVHVRNCFLPYHNIICDIMYEDIEINYDRYKLDLIKKLLSSEMPNESIISITESIVFQVIENAIITDEEFLKIN